MKVTVFNGSPRKDRGNTHVIVKEFLKGVKCAGGSVKNVFLADKKIHSCIGCFNCWKEGECVFYDDMPGLIDDFINSDFVVFATPLYVDNVSGLTKNFMDRLIPVVSPYFEDDNNKESRHCKKYDNYPGFVVISNCGFPEQSHFQVLKLLFKRVARNTHSRVVGEIYRSMGEALQTNHWLGKRLVNVYKRWVRKAGKELVIEGCFSNKTKKKLKNPLMPKFVYNFYAKKEWDKILEKKVL